MPNRWTRVPLRPVPQLPGPVRALVPVADVFMLAMISRPPTGSLRTTWVTPATLELSLAVSLISIPSAIILAILGIGSARPLLIVLALALLLVIVGAGAVAVVGIVQRLEERRRAG